MRGHRIGRWCTAGLLVAILTGTGLLAAGAQKDKLAVTSGMRVSIEYTLKLDDKTVLESNVGAKPFTYVQGAHQIIPGLEKALEGMKIGERKQVTVKPEEGYGLVKKEAFLEVKKEQIPPEALKVGARVQGRDARGRIIRARVAEVKDKTVVLDFNHPLAGKTLYFDIKVVDIQKVTNTQQGPRRPTSSR